MRTNDAQALLTHDAQALPKQCPSNAINGEYATHVEQLTLLENLTLSNARRGAARNGR